MPFRKSQFFLHELKDNQNWVFYVGLNDIDEFLRIISDLSWGLPVITEILTTAFKHWVYNILLELRNPKIINPKSEILN